MGLLFVLISVAVINCHNQKQPRAAKGGFWLTVSREVESTNVREGTATRAGSWLFTSRPHTGHRDGEPEVGSVYKTSKPAPREGLP